MVICIKRTVCENSKLSALGGLFAKSQSHPMTDYKQFINTKTMKKVLLSFLVIAISAYNIIAQIPRELVLVEIGTGVTCGYCPGAAMGLHDLYTNGDPVAGIEYHQYNGGAPFNTPEATIRTSYYGITGYPTAQFDGEYDEHVGGSTSTSLYSTYLPKVTARMAIQTDFTVEIYGDNIGNNYDITVRVTKVGPYTGTNLKVHLALTETDIPYNWLGQTTVDYCDRLMAPDGYGTAVSFAGGNEVDVALTFTFNNTWVDSNCELIAWIQDDDNKFVLHTASVMLLALEPDVANANFSSSADTVCEGGTVQFTDLSTGAITSWDWTFEGGTPPTSTDQNPIVTYSTQGVYDVTLYVSDGTTNSTLLNEDMIEVIVAPVQPDTPVGEMETCSNNSYIYTTQPVPYTDTYVWEVSPPDAGTITGSGTEATFESDNTWTGAYTITVRADNSCGTGIWSAPLSCNLNFTPAAFMLSDGGGICQGGPGLEITQDGSEMGVDYDLYRDNVYTGTTLAGTGSPLSFGFQTVAGTYTVMGVATMCDMQQIGTPWIYYIEDPVQPSIPAGPTNVCNAEASIYSILAVLNADTIFWTLSPVESGAISGGNLEITIDWNHDFTGMAYLNAQGSNECGTGPISDDLEITANETPMPVITGLALICDFEQADYLVEDNTGSTYVWDVVGGDVVAGAGTSIVSILWGDPGNGSVFVTETSADNCVGHSEYFEVVIDDCTGIGEAIDNHGFLLYPNPAKTNIEIVFNEKAGIAYTIVVHNSIGQVMAETNGVAHGEKQNVKIDVSSYRPGIYIVNLSTENGLNIRSAFEKTK